MKYKIIGIAAILMAVLISVIAPTLIKEENGRYIQHESALLRPEDEVDDGTFNSHLPLVMIDTGGTEIPGKPTGAFDDEGHAVYTTATDGEATITATMSIIDNETRYKREGGTLSCNRCDDEPEVETLAEIKIRGRSSRTFDKSNFAVRFVDDKGKNKDYPVMGMDSHHEWILHGPFLDKTLLRNYMWYNISGEIMDYAPNVRFCEVFIDGAYKGVYVMTERITAGGPDGGRLSLSVNKKKETFSGYLLRMDAGRMDPITNVNTFTGYALRRKNDIEIVYPGEKNLTLEINEKIRQDFSLFEKSLYSYDFDNEKYGYKKYIEPRSFADYFIINEFTSNYDAGWLSTYVYKGIDGKLRMCVWDMNSACDNYQESVMDDHVFEMQNCLWYFMLVKDEDFIDLIENRYKELRKTYLSDEYLDSFIDETIDYLGPAIDRNFEVWGYTFDDMQLLVPRERNPRSYDQAVGDMKAFLKSRSQWMDENIGVLYQYCSSGKNKKFMEDAN